MPIGIQENSRDATGPAGKNGKKNTTGKETTGKETTGRTAGAGAIPHPAAGPEAGAG